MKKIVVTGALGFIASNLAKALNRKGFEELILVDDFSKVEKNENLIDVKFQQKIERGAFIEWLSEYSDEVAFIFHLGARTDTTEFNFRILDALNLSYSKAILEICIAHDIPLLYASSAATYGLGENGFDDDETKIETLKPLNPYGVSKQLFDEYLLAQKQLPSHWWGLKFFNVYGEHEQHKGRMASVVFHAFHQINKEKKINLFQSHNEKYGDGEQLRDFIYVADVVAICIYIFEQKIKNGIYNVGTGNARSFNDLAKAVFAALALPTAINYIPTPADIRDKYQYFTEANMQKLIATGYSFPFTSLEDGIKKYVSYLSKNTH